MPPVKKTHRPLQKTYLKEWRDHLHLTQDQAAERLNVSRTLLSKIENGKSPYSQQLLEAAAEAYGTTPASLIMRNPLAENGVWSIQEQLAKASPDKRAEILEIVTVMLSRAS